MFENPIKKYRIGGSTPSEQEKQQVMTAFQSVADKLQIPVENLVQKIQESQDENEQKARIEAVARASQGDTSALQVIAGWFKQSAKLGGKIRDFICKHAKGGAIAGCGCQKAEMGAELGGPKNAHVDVPNIPYLKMQLTAKRVPNAGKAVNRNFGASNYKGNQYFLEKATVDGTDAETRFMVIPEKHDTLVDQVVNGRHNQLTPEQVEAVMARNRGLMNGVRQQENGGIVKAQDGVTLSRKEAIAAAENTYGFNKAIANRAYANAINGLRKQGIRGAELKQKGREMMFKMPEISDDIIIEEPMLEIPTFDKLDTSLNVQTVETPQPVKSVKQESVKTRSTQVEPKTIAKSWNYKPIKVEKYQIASSSNGTKPVEQQSVANQPVVEQPSVSIIEEVPVVKQPVDSLSLTGFIEPSIVSSSFEKVATATNNNFSQPYWLRRNNELLVKEGERAQRAAERQPWLQRLFSRRNKQTIKRSPVIGGTYSISNNPIEAYIKGAGLGIGTDVILNNGQYVWAKTGQPVEVPTIRKNNGQIVPVVQKNGGVVKHNWLNKTKK